MNAVRRMIALLLIGGAGTRLWPLSTEQRPKQFLKLFGNRSLMQMTAERLRAAGCENLVMVSNAALLPHVRADIAEAGLPISSFVIEPVRRDSGPAIAAATAYVRRRWGKEAIIGVFPGDHLIRDDGAFTGALQAGASLAAAGFLVTFGIRPTFPATSYGYIERGTELSAYAGAYAVTKFHEKPDAATAAAYVKDGRYDWNSGMFVFAAATFARDAAEHMPDVWESAQSAVAGGQTSGEGIVLDAESFNAARKTSIDYALMEKSRRVAVLPVSFSWSDVGDWASVYAALEKDARGNAIVGDVRMQNCFGTLAIGHDAPLAIAGLADMVAVATKDGVFVAPLSRAADVKTLIGG